MKAILITILGCVLMSSYSYASCGGGCETETCVNRCQCSDPNYNSNPCLTVEQFCEAYGNISGLDAYP
jgi:hypothetical protein